MFAHFCLALSLLKWDLMSFFEPNHCWNNYKVVFSYLFVALLGLVLLCNSCSHSFKWNDNCAALWCSPFWQWTEDSDPMGPSSGEHGRRILTAVTLREPEEVSYVVGMANSDTSPVELASGNGGICMCEKAGQRGTTPYWVYSEKPELHHLLFVFLDCNLRNDT